jgi:hypothetical protein
MCRLTLETDTPAAEILAALVNQTALAKAITPSNVSHLHLPLFAAI